MRKKVIAGNWKMNMLPNEGIAFIEEFTPLVKDSENEVVFDWGADAAKELKGNWVELNITAK